jgi:glyoxylase-like metal-dependent hydrolase (beta-lactamase superfamily II)
MRELAEGVYQLEVPMRHNPLGYTYSYLLRDEATIIDTGVGTNQAFTRLSEQLGPIGLAVSDLRRIILTHLHGDHIGLVDRVRSISGSIVYAHRSAVDIERRRRDGGGGTYEDIRDELKLLGGSGYLNVFTRFERAFRRPRPRLSIDEPLDDGELLELVGSTLKVFWTPGHAPEHICLHDHEKRILFSGDHVLPKITSHISLHTYQEGDPLRDYLRSLDRLHGLPVKTVFPAHEHVFEDLDGRIDALKLHHVKRCDEVKYTMKDGERTVFQISAEVSWDSRPWPKMEFWTKRMAAAETLAHLIYMKNRGEIEDEEKGGVLYFSISR